MKDKIKSTAVSIANSLRSKLGFSKALKCGYQIARLKELMKDNFVVVQFKTVKGEFREYTATLNHSFFQWANTTGRTSKKKHNQISFYCLESDSIKSFLAENFIDTIKVLNIKETLRPQLLGAA